MMKKRILALMLAMVLAIPMLSGCGSKQEELNIYTWEDYVPDSVVEAFEKETGIKVNYTNFQTNEEMLSVLSNAKGGDYDIILAYDI